MRTGIWIFFLLVVAAHTAAALNPRAMQDWTIVVADNALPSERYAGEEFQALFKQATGLSLPITAAAPNKKHNIFIGPDAVATAGWRAFGVDKLGEEGLHIRITRNNILIAGGRPRGTLYGVYEFFERHLGVRFLTCDHTYTPAPDQLGMIKTENYTYVPPFSFRWSFYKENTDRPDFAARLRVNTVQQDEKLGGKTKQSLINHSLYRWLTPAQYGKDHSEYFALVKGERKLDVGGGGPEPCPTNPEVIDIVANGVLKDLDADPTQQNISVSQNDNDEYCRCPRCEEIIKREGTPMGPQLMLVNAVADRVAEKYPNVKVGTLAYWYTRKPPKTLRPRPNMQIQLCSIECCTFHAIDDPACPKNRIFCADMRNWKAISNDIWVWNYNTNFSCYDLPFPNLRSIGANVRFFSDNNVKGVFMQANGGGITGELSDLRNYVIAKCIWHPGQESWPLVEEFCRLHYQESAPPILAYLKDLHDNVDKLGLHPNCFPDWRKVGLNPEMAGRAFACFEDALARAQSDEVRARVEKASICAYKAMILAGGGAWTYQDGACRRQWPGARMENLVERYMALAQKYGMERSDEGTLAETYFEKLRRENAPAAVRLENAVWRITVLPDENGKIVELFHKPTSRNMVSGITHAELLKGTIEENGAQGYDEDKPSAFTAVQEGTCLKLTKALEDGSVLERRITLKDEQPSAIFFSTQLIHRGPVPKTYQFEACPEFDPGSKSARTDVVSAYVKDTAWTCFNSGWHMDRGPKGDVLKQAKGGGLAFFNHTDRFGMLLRYDPAGYAEPGLYWRPEWPQINLELTTPAVELTTGGAMSFSYVLEYLNDAPK